nr:MAG TPA: hypothetical protein [Caudoviricetes sp.]
MQCACGRELQPGDRYCPGCGADLAPNGDMANNIGGHNFGSQYLAGRDLYVSADPQDSSEKATYEAIPKWRSPFTQAVLTWIGLFTGLASLVPLGKILAPVIDLLRLGSLGTAGQASGIVAIFAFFVLVVITAITFSMRSVAKKQLRVPVLPGWAINGSGRRITLERIRGGKCPQCGGKLRYYNKDIKWEDVLFQNGETKREVTRRSPVLECRRNAKHWYAVDPAEELVQ